MVKRLFDIVVSAAALAVLSPVLLLAALGVWLSGRGPVFYRARRVGRGGVLFTMHKFRTMGGRLLAGGDPEEAYVKKLLPIKLALEAVYVREASFWYDLTILLRTALVILLIACGRRRFRNPPEMRKVTRFVPARLAGLPE